MATVIPPESVTVSTMVVMRQRVNLYLRENGTQPKSVDELPVIPDKGSRNLDGWGRKIEISVHDDKLTFTSLGADGVQGGIGENKDYIATMRIVNGQAEWINGPEL